MTTLIRLNYFAAGVPWRLFILILRNGGVNVQPYSCTSANFAVYTGLLLPKDRIMGLDSPSGGHLSHGYYMPSGKKVSGTSIFFESLPYKVNPQTGYIDYDKLEEKALDFRPKILICGGSSYPREWNYARFRQIADKCGAVLMCDMAQISVLWRLRLVYAKLGFLSTKVDGAATLRWTNAISKMFTHMLFAHANPMLCTDRLGGCNCGFPSTILYLECASPFDYCDIVTSTTHKNLRGPRGGIIFYRKGAKARKPGMLLSQGDDSNQYDFEERINFAVFPSLQGGPHNNHIAALAIALKQVATPEYKAYMQQVKKNAQALAAALLRKSCKLVTEGKNYEKVCELCHITLNKTAIYGDNGAISPGGVRIGSPAMTTRGCLEADFETIAEFLYRAAVITSAVVTQRELRKFPRDFFKCLQNNKDIVELRNQVETFASQFAMPGFDI
ncbi:Serine hydroxymethyltransferase 7 [Vitis vinifera]|uniref:glycine hydroxymethyltransferase n=1 Tax=Vitis vinifera TaxID=29760 RepID=A0A438F7W2_VITVI|nr:Serine hydroxymethyltransferase 7 [Vitis vinifera]